MEVRNDSTLLSNHIADTGSRHISTIGALITVLALAIEPFTQQVLSYRLQQTLVANSSGTASTAQVRWYFNDHVSSLHQAAVYGGVLGNQFREICPTSNCTWKPYSTLAICSQCANITNFIRDKKADSLSTDERFYSMSLPNGLSLDYGERLNFSANLDPVGLRNYGFSILNMTLLSQSNKSVEDRSTRKTPLAVECSLYWCVNTYNSSVTSSTTNEAFVASSVNASKPEFSWSNSIGGAEYGSYLYKMRGWDPNSTPPSSDTIPLTDDIAPQNLSDTSIRDTITSPFYVSKESSEEMTAWMQSVFNQSNEVAINGFSNKRVGLTPGVLPLTTDMFSSIASSLTAVIRAYPNNAYPITNNGVATIYGSAWTNDTYVYIKWEWLILPISLVALTILFLAITIVQTKRNDMAIWKTSTLALLFHGLRADDVGLPDGKLRLATMEETARHAKVQWDNEKGVWRRRMSI